MIQRKGTPTREDTLAARLKSLRSQESSPSSVKVAPPSSPQPSSTSLAEKSPILGAPRLTAEDEKVPREEDDDVDAVFQTDDQTLEELLGDVGTGETFTAEPDDEKVKELLEELSQAIPKDGESRDDEKGGGRGGRGRDSDDSDGEEMQRDVDEVIARFRDEIQVEAALSRDAPRTSSETPDQDKPPIDSDTDDQQPPPDITLPSVPTDTTSPNPRNSPNPPSSSIDDITARLSALRATSTSPSLDLPSVPTSKPAKAPKRLESRTTYTDDDVDSWCTVCLADATLLCLGCADTDEGKEGDPYCVRCWREMHVGPAAAFDDRDHKAVQLTRAPKRDKANKAVALGA